MRFAYFLPIIVTITICWPQERASFDGTWVLRSDGENVLKLSLSTKDGIIKGSLTKPKKISFDPDGSFSDFGPGQEELPVQKSMPNVGRLELTIDDDHLTFVLLDKDRALLSLEGLPPWKLERAAAGSTIILADRPAQRDYPVKIVELRKHLHEMVAEEQNARMAFDTARMEAEDAKNRAEVLRIFGEYGWVTKSLAGKDASHDFWLLVQHQTPEIQQRLLPALEKAAKAGEASMSDYAYLYDRVQMGLGKPQRWGSQVKCEGGKPSLYTVLDPAGLDARRKELFLPPIAEYLKMDYLIKSCAASK